MYPPALHHQILAAMGVTPDKVKEMRNKAGSASEKHECVVCLEREPDMIVSCMHLCLCEQCSEAINKRPKESRQCPVCRRPVDAIKKVYTQ